ARSGVSTRTTRVRPSRGNRGRNLRMKPDAREAEPGRPPANATRSLANVLGSGACILGYDGDGTPDVFLVNADGDGHPALYRNVGRGKFVDVRKTAKFEFYGEGTGCAVGDYDN